jgi:hypothetical protein
MRKYQYLMIIIGALLLVGAMVFSGCENNNNEKADLVPVQKDLQFCSRSSGQLVVYVKNQGDGDALDSTVTAVTFSVYTNGNFTDAIVTENASAIMAGQTIEQYFDIPSNCFVSDCSFTITVDYSDAIDESNEANNTADGTCLG